MAKITQSRKRLPIADGRIESLGASNWNGHSWEGMNLSIRTDLSINGEDYDRPKFTTLYVNRAEAQRIVDVFTKYLEADKVTGPDGSSSRRFV